MRNFVINIIDTHNSLVIPIVERFAENDSLQLNYNGSDSRFDAIVGSEFSFAIDNETAEDGRYLDLFSGQERKFKVEIREQNVPSAQELIWQGYLLPDIYSEPYENVRFFVRFTASDGLGALKSKPFVPYKTDSVLKYIARCLIETGLQQEIYFAPGIENLAMNWNEIQLFEEEFTEVRNNGTTKRSNCYDVLENCLKAVGATLFSWNGKWFIVGYNRKHLTVDTFKVYSPMGAFVRNEVVTRNVHQGYFAKGLQVNMAQPFKRVQLNVSYNRASDEIFPRELFENADLTPTEIDNGYTDASVRNKAPLKHWSESGNGKKMLGSEDAKLTLNVASEDVSGSFPVHPAGVYPASQIAPPGYVRVYAPYNLTTNWNTSYIELKDANALFLSPQNDGKPQEFTFNAELRAFPYVDKTKYEEDFYRQVFRMEVFIGTQLLFTTRGEATGYNSSDVTIKFVEGSTGPNYTWYQAPNISTPAGTIKRWAIPNRLECEIKDIKRTSSASGPLKIRLYIPRNKDNAKTTDGKHILHVILKNFEVEVNDWDDENYIKTRSTASSTSFEIDLAFSDGKSDLYNNLFKLGERADYLMAINASIDVLATGYTSSDAVNYYITFPSLTAGATIERIKREYSLLQMGRGNETIRVCRVFGDLSVDSGFYINDMGAVTIRKSRIDEFPEFRAILHGMNRLTLPTMSAHGFVQEYTRTQYVNWKCIHASSPSRYLEAYASMIHDCQAVVSPRLDGDLMRLISPLDIVKFNYLGEKNFFPTRLTLDFSSGKSRVYMIEASINTVTDYVD